MTTSSTYSDDFDNYARDPNIWLFESRCQIAVANVLFDSFDQKLVNGTVEERNGYYKTAMFHAGLAIENAAKAVLIKRNPNLIQNKKIDFKNMCGQSGHEILKCTKSAVGNLSPKQERLLTKLQQYVIWAGKYTLPRNGIILDNHHLRQEMRLISKEDRTTINDILNRLTDLANSYEE